MTQETFLKPRLKDLLEGNVYVYNVNTKPIYIPLWALNIELCYDDENNEELVFESIFTNTINASLRVSTINLNEETNDITINVNLKLKDIFNKEKIDLLIDGFNISIDVDTIKLKKNQLISLLGKGIPIYNSNDTFNINNRANIYILLELGFDE